jgi:hypothetical protein
MGEMVESSRPRRETENLRIFYFEVAKLQGRFPSICILGSCYESEYVQ